MSAAEQQTQRPRVESWAATACSYSTPPSTLENGVVRLTPCSNLGTNRFLSTGSSKRPRIPCGKRRRGVNELERVLKRFTCRASASGGSRPDSRQYPRRAGLTECEAPYHSVQSGDTSTLRSVAQTVRETCVTTGRNHHASTATLKAQSWRLVANVPVRPVW